MHRNKSNKIDWYKTHTHTYTCTDKYACIYREQSTHSPIRIHVIYEIAGAKLSTFLITHAHTITIHPHPPNSRNLYTQKVVVLAVVFQSFCPVHVPVSIWTLFFYKTFIITHIFCLFLFCSFIIPSVYFIFSFFCVKYHTTDLFCKIFICSGFISAYWINFPHICNRMCSFVWVLFCFIFNDGNNQGRIHVSTSNAIN